MFGAEVVGPRGCPDHEHVTVGDLPPQARLVERLVDRARVLVDHDAEPVPGHGSHAEHLVVVGHAVRHGVPPFMRLMCMAEQLAWSAPVQVDGACGPSEPSARRGQIRGLPHSRRASARWRLSADRPPLLAPGRHRAVAGNRSRSGSVQMRRDRGQDHLTAFD